MLGGNAKHRVDLFQNFFVLISRHSNRLESLISLKRLDDWSHLDGLRTSIGNGHIFGLAIVLLRGQSGSKLLHKISGTTWVGGFIRGHFTDTS